jgi:putative tryptophan/tyrosine transport system substrate-binding protein
MRRRAFITLLGGAIAAAPRATFAQADRVRRIGVLMALAADDPETRARVAKFQQELEKLGWSEGRNVSIDVRFGASSAERFRLLAKELVASQPDVIVAHSSPVATALQRETRAIPIVFVNVSDPIGEGFISGLARPGGNLTGVMHYEPGIVGKWLAMLKEIAPPLARVALVTNPKTTAYNYFLRAAQAAAPAVAIELVQTPVANAADIERAIEAFARVPNGGLMVPPDPTIIAQRAVVIAQAERYRLPAVYPFRLYVTAGGLMAYGTQQVEMFGQTASYVARILRGASPTELPVQAPVKYETVVNLKAAKAIGLEVPPTLLVRADEVIE